MNELKGTDFFMAPECFQKERDRTVDGKALDVWALGVTIFCFYYRRLPFYGDDLEVLIEEIKGKE
jgi:serine/threonine protein kinase